MQIASLQATERSVSADRDTRWDQGRIDLIYHCLSSELKMILKIFKNFIVVNHEINKEGSYN